MKLRYLILLCGLVIAACGLTDFEAPSWEVGLRNIPLMNRTFSAADLEGENIIIENDTLKVTIEGSIEEVAPALVKSVNSSTPDLPLVSNQSTPNSLFLQSLTPETEIRVLNGIIESGVMDIELNDSFLDFNYIEIQFNQLLNSDGSTHILTINKNDFIDSMYLFHLDGLTLGSQDLNEENIILDFNLYCSSDLADNTPLGLIRLSMQDDIMFSEFNGYINDVRALDYEQDVDIDYPQNVEDALMIKSANIYFTIYNEIGFDFYFLGDLVAYKDGAEVDRISIHEDLGVDFTAAAATNPGQVMTTDINIVDNERANQMLRLMPDRIAFINPLYEVNNVTATEPGFVSNQHTIRCDFNVVIPAEIDVFSDYSIIPNDYIEIEIDSANQDMIDDRVDSASIDLTLINNFDFGGKVDLYISSTEIDTSQVSLDNSEIQLLDNEINATSEEQIISIELSKGELNKDLNTFLNDKIYVRFRVKLNNTDGYLVVMANDGLTIKGDLSLNVMIDEGDK